ncbi:hypothetical protein HPB49_003578 [Dermacentor silvarum]|uniref:Uncharacterized protein n=1 Tax=Dermacentor silvarum TaxID=543639 RepID=A0ACB8DTL9_DERSI|nr:hypothetical protein HPB49_003578 [Dermacentor silvarum]
MTNFLAHSQEAIAAQLSRVAGAHRIRVNFLLNIVAADAATDAPLDPLLAVTEICGVPVRTTTAPADSCTGYVFGVERNLSDDTLLALSGPELALSRVLRYLGASVRAETLSSVSRAGSSLLRSHCLRCAGPCSGSARVLGSATTVAPTAMWPRPAPRNNVAFVVRVPTKRPAARPDKPPA